LRVDKVIALKPVCSFLAHPVCQKYVQVMASDKVGPFDSDMVYRYFVFFIFTRWRHMSPAWYGEKNPT